jgi:poly-gamma-glutamate synthesis protein (capsule biosynthesis protein)
MKFAEWFVLGCALGTLGTIGVAYATLQAPLAPTTQASSILLPKAPNEPVDVLFVGDVMLDRDVAVHGQEVGWDKLFAGVKDLFAGRHFIVGNLEGTITTNDSIAQRDHTILAFTFDNSVADILAHAGFGAMSLANNHAFDFGLDGYAQTTRFLSHAGVRSFGSPYNNLNLSVSVPILKQTLCLVGYHELFAPDPSAVLSEISTIRPTCDHLVVMAHWGVEYEHLPTAEQQKFAHAFIDVGADVVIGGHPHVVEPVEIYKNHAIFYSLGNFIFDQAFRPEVERGLAVQILFEESSTRFILTPVTTVKEVAIAGGDIAAAVLDDVATPYLAPEMAEAVKSASSFELVKQ